MSSGKMAKLVGMANQIGAAFADQPAESAGADAAAHIALFWTPKMIREIVGHAGDGEAGLNPTARAAVKNLGRPANRATGGETR